MGSSYTPEKAKAGLAFTHQVINVSLALFFISGVAMFVIAYITKQREKASPATLTKVMWKFVPEVNLQERRDDLTWNFRRLLILGVVLTSLYTATFSMRMDVHRTLHHASYFFGLWVVSVCVFWHFYVERTLAALRGGMDAKNRLDASDELQKKIDEATSAAWKNKLRTKRDESTSKQEDNRLPVTIVTGFLGAGKTTLIKNILQNTQGLKVLVIENEIGNESIDHELLMTQTKEEIIKMENGCVCCTVRKDLLLTFHRMFENEAFAQLDWVVIETTGLADPAPLIQSLYMDAICASKLRLDGVLTLADAKHLPLHLNREKALGAEEKNKAGVHGGALEARLQLVFADRILLNKVDLATDAELQELKDTVQKLNPMAHIFTCTRSRIDIAQILNIHAFDVNRNEALLKETTDDNVGEDGENSDIQISRERTTGTCPTTEAKPSFIAGLDSSGKIVSSTSTAMKKSAYAAGARKKQGISTSSNSKAREAANAFMRKQKAGRKVTKGVSTISLTSEEPLDLNAFNNWMADILRDKGEKLYRVKGILWMHGYEEKFVAHGVHMVFDGERGEPWTEKLVAEGGRRLSRLVFIGLDMDHAELTEGYYATCYKSVQQKMQKDNKKAESQGQEKPPASEKTKAKSAKAD